MAQALERLAALLWSWPLLVLILGTGIYLTVRLRFLPIRRLGRAVALSVRPGTGSGISPFASLCTMLSATVGTGNIVGVASALALGGPGALFWMELSALTGLAVKYAEGYLAVRWRYTEPDGTHWGGPFAYLSLGLGRSGRGLARAFALFGALAGLCGVGTLVQIGSVTDALRYCLARSGRQLWMLSGLGRPVPLAAAIMGLIMTLAAGAIIAGGIRRISGVSTLLVPVMGGLYALCCVWIVLRHLGALPDALRAVWQGAFGLRPAGCGIFAAMQAGISRGVFSNETGLGTSPIACAASSADDPQKQGCVNMAGTVFDTFLICTLTGLAILVSGADPARAGLAATMEAFALGLPLPPGLSRGLVFVCLALFAFTTAVGWSYYGLSCLRCFTSRGRGLYLGIYVLTMGLAPYLPVGSLWQASSVCNALMAIPNLIGILLLSPVLDGHDIMEKNPGDLGKEPQYGDPLSRQTDFGVRQAPGRGIDRRARRPAGAAADGFR